MLEDILYDLCITREVLLARVDEYTLYCHYLEFEPELTGSSYPSPLREGDDTPSFGVYYSRKRTDVCFMWKDHAYRDPVTGKTGISGDIFKLVKLLYGYDNESDVFRHIRDDFGLEQFNGKREKVIKAIAPPKVDYQIAVKSRPFTPKDLAYWLQFNVTRELLERYNVTAVAAYWMSKEQRTPSFPKSDMYAYRIWDRYQLYMPAAERKRKFRNNWLEQYIPGFEQLEYNSDLLIITKSYKDVMLFRSFNYEAVASRGEDVPLPDEFMEYARKRYSRIVTWQDNDGKTGVDKYYPDLEHFVCPGNPANGDPKDPTDYCKKYGPTETARLINNTLWRHH